MANKDKVLKNQRDYYAANSEKRREHAKIYRARHPEKAKATAKASRIKNMPRVLEWNKRWAIANPDKKRASDIAYAKAHPENVRENSRRWRKAHPEYFADLRARRRAADGRFTSADIDRIFKGQRGCCAICQGKFEKDKMHRDHIIPLKRGGTNWPSNIQLLCVSCNCRKGAKDPIEFARETGRLL